MPRPLLVVDVEPESNDSGGHRDGKRRSLGRPQAICESVAFFHRAVQGAVVTRAD